MRDSGYDLSQQQTSMGILHFALGTNPSVSILSCAGESTASRPREAIFPFPEGFVSPPEHKGFDILEKVQWRIVVSRTEVSPRSHCVF